MDLIFCLKFTFLILLTNGMVNAHFIKLRNGQSTQTTIVDTAGCEVVIIRKEKKTTIKKKLIEFIIIDNDTTSYLDFKCSKVPKKIKRYSETTEYKLFQKITDLPEDKQSLVKDKKIAYLSYPLHGTVKPGIIAYFKDEISEILSTTGKLSIVSSDSLFRMLGYKHPAFDYAFVILRYIDLENTGRKKFPLSVSGSDKKEVFTIAEICFVDLSAKKIVFRDVIRKKKSVHEVRNPSDFIPEDVEEKIMKYKVTGAVYWNNARVIREVKQRLIKYIKH